MSVGNSYIKNVHAGQGALVDLFDHIENYFQRLVVYTGVWPTTAMMDGIVKIMIDLFLILGIVTKEAGQGRTSTSFLVDFNHKTHLLEGKFFKKLVAGKKDVEDALQRLDKLTLEVAQQAETEIQVLTGTLRNVNEVQVMDKENPPSALIHTRGKMSQRQLSQAPTRQEMSQRQPPPIVPPVARMPSSSSRRSRTTSERRSIRGDDMPKRERPRSNLNPQKRPPMAFDEDLPPVPSRIRTISAFAPSSSKSPSTQPSPGECYRRLYA